LTTVLIVGCGYTGLRLATQLLAEGTRVYGLVSSEASGARLQGAGVTPVIADLDSAAQLTSRLPAAEQVVYLAPPPREGLQDLRIDRVLGALGAGPDALIYASTSGVYGNCGGAWVDEKRPPNPESERARRRLDAEARINAWARDHERRAVILRVAGIYGPDRLPLPRLRAGTPVICPDEAPYTNRIHVDDLATACRTALASGSGTYNVADDQPTTATAYFYRVADRAGLPRPPCVGMAAAPEVLSPMMLSFLRESRRLDNRRLRKELGVRLQYPDLESGLASLLPAGA